MKVISVNKGCAKIQVAIAGRTHHAQLVTRKPVDSLYKLANGDTITVSEAAIVKALFI